MQRLGRVVATDLEPGLHLHWPAPIGLRLRRRRRRRAPAPGRLRRQRCGRPPAESATSRSSSPPTRTWSTCARSWRGASSIPPASRSGSTGPTRCCARSRAACWWTIAAGRSDRLDVRRRPARRRTRLPRRADRRSRGARSRLPRTRRAPARRARASQRARRLPRRRERARGSRDRSARRQRLRRRASRRGPGRVRGDPRGGARRGDARGARWRKARRVRSRASRAPTTRTRNSPSGASGSSRSSARCSRRASSSWPPAPTAATSISGSAAPPRRRPSRCPSRRPAARPGARTHAHHEDPARPARRHRPARSPLATALVVVDETEHVVITQFGRPVAVFSDAGLHAKAAGAGPARDAPRQAHPLHRQQPTELLTSDKKNVIVSTYLSWRIADPLRFMTVAAHARGRRGAARRARAVGTRQHARRPAVLEHRARADRRRRPRAGRRSACRRACHDAALRDFGIEVTSFGVTRLGYPAQNLQSVFARMRAERERIARGYRSEGKAAAQKIRAEADRERSTALANAEAEAAAPRGRRRGRGGARLRRRLSGSRGLLPLPAHARELREGAQGEHDAGAAGRLAVPRAAALEARGRPRGPTEGTTRGEAIRALEAAALRRRAAAACSRWLAAGVYSVESDQSGVAFVLGRVVGRDVLPGIHWNPAWPIGRVVVEKTATNFTMPVGYRLLEQPGAAPISDLWLTGDTNVVTDALDIQYSVKSLADLLLAHESPRELLRRAGERVLSRVPRLGGRRRDPHHQAPRADRVRARRACSRSSTHTASASRSRRSASRSWRRRCRATCAAPSRRCRTPTRIASARSSRRAPTRRRWWPRRRARPSGASPRRPASATAASRSPRARPSASSRLRASTTARPASPKTASTSRRSSASCRGSRTTWSSRARAGRVNLRVMR